MHCVQLCVFIRLGQPHRVMNFFILKLVSRDIIQLIQYLQLQSKSVQLSGIQLSAVQLSTVEPRFSEPSLILVYALVYLLGWCISSCVIETVISSLRTSNDFTCHCAFV